MAGKQTVVDLDVEMNRIIPGHTAWQDQVVQQHLKIQTASWEELAGDDDSPSQFARTEQDSSHILEKTRQAEAGERNSESKAATAMDTITTVVEADEARALDTVKQDIESNMMQGIAKVEACSIALGRVVNAAAENKGLNSMLGDLFTPEQLARMTRDEKAEHVENLENSQIVEREKAAIDLVSQLQSDVVERELVVSSDNQKLILQQSDVAQDLGADASCALVLKSEGDTIVQALTTLLKSLQEQVEDSKRLNDELVQMEELKERALKEAWRAVYKCTEDWQSAQLNRRRNQLKLDKQMALKDETDRRVNVAMQANAHLQSAADSAHQRANTLRDQLNHRVQQESGNCAQRAAVLVDMAVKRLQVADAVIHELTSDNADRRSHTVTKKDAVDSRIQVLESQSLSGNPESGGRKLDLSLAIGVEKDKRERHATMLTQCDVFDETIKTSRTLYVQRSQTLEEHSKLLHLTLPSVDSFGVDMKKKAFQDIPIWFSHRSNLEVSEVAVFAEAAGA